MDKNRFVVTYTQGSAELRKVLVDRETGVNYLLASTATTGGIGLTVLLGPDGKPLVTPIPDAE